MTSGTAVASASPSLPSLPSALSLPSSPSPPSFSGSPELGSTFDWIRDLLGLGPSAPADPTDPDDIDQARVRFLEIADNDNEDWQGGIVRQDGSIVCTADVATNDNFLDLVDEVEAGDRIPDVPFGTAIDGDDEFTRIIVCEDTTDIDSP